MKLQVYPPPRSQCGTHYKGIIIPTLTAEKETRLSLPLGRAAVAPAPEDFPQHSNFLPFPAGSNGTRLHVSPSQQRVPHQSNNTGSRQISNLSVLVGNLEHSPEKPREHRLPQRRPDAASSGLFRLLFRIMEGRLGEGRKKKETQNITVVQM